MNSCHEMMQTELPIQQTILHCYKKMGETEKAINQIEQHIQCLLRSDNSTDSFISRSRHLADVQITETPQGHQSYRLVETGNFKVALHTVPGNFEIPSHIHARTINIVYVLRGNLKIQQQSFPDFRQKSLFHKGPGEACAGLCQLRNIHRLQSGDFPCMFFSIRVKVPVNNKAHFRLNLTSSLLAGLMLINPFAYADQRITTISIVSSTLSKNNSDNSNLELAHKLRKGIGMTRNLYRAARLYMKEAGRGNAEAQYWLGMMYLTGAGITDDKHEALRWIAAASDQDYPPARKMLNYMLETDEVLDC
jgi:hypothetical protein